MSEEQEQGLGSMLDGNFDTAIAWLEKAIATPRRSSANRLIGDAIVELKCVHMDLTEGK